MPDHTPPPVSASLAPAFSRHRLVEIPGYPAPRGGTVEMLPGAHGVSLRTAIWPPAPGLPISGTLCLLQGRAETIEKYFETIGELQARGFWVATLDWRGQGGSDRLLANSRHGHVEDFADHRTDLAAFLATVRWVAPPPYLALSHSMGGLILAGAMAEGTVAFDRAVMVAPLLALSQAVAPPPAAVAALARLAVFGGLRDRPIPGQNQYAPDLLAFANNPLTRDPGRFARNQALFRSAPELVVAGATFGWMYAAVRAMRAAARPDFLAAITAPVLVIPAGEDLVVSTPAAARFAASLPRGRSIVMRGAHHEILMESEEKRAMLFAAFDAFVAAKA